MCCTSELALCLGPRRTFAVSPRVMNDTQIYQAEGKTERERVMDNGRETDGYREARREGREG